MTAIKIRSSSIEISFLFSPFHMLYKGECLPHVLVFSEVSLISTTIFLLLSIFFFLCIFVCLTSNWSHYDTVKLSFPKRGAIQKFLTDVFFTVTGVCYLYNGHWPVEGSLFTCITFPDVLYIPYCTVHHFRGFHVNNYLICRFFTSRLKVSL